MLKKVVMFTAVLAMMFGVLGNIDVSKSEDYDDIPFEDMDVD